MLRGRASRPSTGTGRPASYRWSFQRDLKSIVRRSRPVGQLGYQGTIIEAVAHMHQVKLADAEVSRKTKNAVEMHVRRMWLARQAVSNPNVDTPIQLGHFVAQVAEIDGVTNRLPAFVET